MDNIISEKQQSQAQQSENKSTTQNESVNQSTNDFVNYKPKKFQFIRDIWSFMKVRKKWWLLPLLILLVLVGILVVVGQSSALSPFLYALF